MPRSLTDAQVQAATDFLITARQKSEPFESIPEDCRPDTIDDATRVSEQLAEVLSRRPVGWKAGYSSPEQLRTLPTGAPPSSPPYAGMLQDSPAQLSTAVYRTCMIEAEVAFRLGWDLPPRDTPYAVEEVRDAVASAHAVIEAPNVRFAAGRDIGLPSIIADGYAAETLVIGPAIEDWRDRDLTAIEIELLFDGGIVAGGLEGDQRCDPLGVLHAMANDTSRRPDGLLAGQVITTGQAAPATQIQPGQTAVARFVGIGDVNVALV